MDAHRRRASDRGGSGIRLVTLWHHPRIGGILGWCNLERAFNLEQGSLPKTGALTRTDARVICPPCQHYRVTSRLALNAWAGVLVGSEQIAGLGPGCRFRAGSLVFRGVFSRECRASGGATSSWWRSLRRLRRQCSRCASCLTGPLCQRFAGLRQLIDLFVSKSSRVVWSGLLGWIESIHCPLIWYGLRVDLRLCLVVNTVK